ncbi:VWA domain-containing protein [Candidatus Sumerlaeota bacterium]|nr:VWA domain-containing protein [Candidatus Sumerlaeota bacterium]
MQFAHPDILLAIFALPLLGLFFWWSQRRKHRLLERFGQWAIIARLIGTTSTARQIVRMALLGLSVALFIVALARPQYGASVRQLTRRGIDLMIAVDVSNSMLAGDIPPSRLARAKEQLRQLIINSRGHRIGVIAFAGAAFVQCPLTLDYGIALNILDAIEVGIVPFQGTSIGEAIDCAVDAFERGEGAESEARRSGKMGARVLLLLTDGEDHDKAALENAVKRAAAANIKIYAVGIGSTQGVDIKMPDGSVKKDTEGRVVTTRLDFETLQRAAFATDGVAIRGTAQGDLDILEVEKRLDALDQDVQRSTTRVVYEERFAPLLALIVILLVWEMLQTDRRRTEGKRQKAEG